MCSSGQQQQSLLLVPWHQPLSEQYKTELIRSIQKVLSEEVENHQNRLQEQVLLELELDLDPFQRLPTYQACLDQIAALNQCIQSNNGLLLSKKADPYTPINSVLTDIEQVVSALTDALRQLENDRLRHNRTVADTRPIKTELTRINNEIAYWDVVDLSRQHDAMQNEKANAENACNEAQQSYNEKLNRLNELNAQRDSIDIAIDVINDGLKYIFFSENRMQILIGLFVMDIQ